MGKTESKLNSESKNNKDSQNKYRESIGSDYTTFGKSNRKDIGSDNTKSFVYNNMTGEEKLISAIIVGAGSRGHGYPSYALHFPHKLKVVGVCEPREYHRNIEVEKHKIPAENVFKDWTEAAKKDKFADFVFICTPDRLHKGPAIAFAKKGYHLLVEKPLAVTAADCKEIVETCKENNVMLSVCHVLRYTPWVKKVKEIIESGRIGEIVNINHTEPVGFWHFAHSFVRGNWCREEDSSFSLLAKCCHDVDLICHWMEDKPCERVSSFGCLSHFNKASKPQGAASRCLDCPQHIESKCPYSAKEIYIGMTKQGHTGWPVSVITDIVDIENVTEALKKGPYGKCVYDTDNNVMSQQVVNMQFKGGATATLTMVAFTEKICARETKFYGTKGQMTVEAGWNTKIEVFDFLSQKRTPEKCEQRKNIPASLMGHDGADFHTVQSFVNTLLNPTDNQIQTGPDDTLASHLLTFAAERARKENKVLNRNEAGEYV